MVKLSQQIPTIYKRLHDTFGVDWSRGLIIANGDTIHHKNVNLPTWKLAHERVHLDQQAEFPSGLDAWWDEYITNPQFRLLQELEAYRAEWKKICEVIDSREQKYQLLSTAAIALSGPMYGRLISYTEALKQIKL